MELSDCEVVGSNGFLSGCSYSFAIALTTNGVRDDLETSRRVIACCLVVMQARRIYTMGIT